MNPSRRPPSPSMTLINELTAGELADEVCCGGARPQAAASVLLVSPFEEDLASLHQILHDSDYAIHCARTCREAAAALRKRLMNVLICESELPDGNWKDVLEALMLAVDAPRLIVTSRLADEYLWAEVLNLGGYDVLMKPFDAKEVSRVVSLAWWRWQDGRDRRYQSLKSAQATAS